jgi:hypothetical protein
MVRMLLHIVQGNKTGVTASLDHHVTSSVKAVSVTSRAAGLSFGGRSQQTDNRKTPRQTAFQRINNFIISQN